MSRRYMAAIAAQRALEMQLLEKVKASRQKVEVLYQRLLDREKHLTRMIDALDRYASELADLVVLENPEGLPSQAVPSTETLSALDLSDVIDIQDLEDLR